MRLRQAKKIFNRVCRMECDIIRRGLPDYSEQTMMLTHLVAVGSCGYRMRQVDAAMVRLGRHSNRHPKFRPEFLAK